MAVLAINEIEEKMREEEDGHQRNLAILAQRVVMPEKWTLQIIKNARKCACPRLCCICIIIFQLRVHKRFVRTGKVYAVDVHGKKFKRGDERNILLFNDLFLVAEVKSKKSEELYYLKDSADVVHLQCYDRADESGPPGIVFRFSSSLMHIVIVGASHLIEIVGLTHEKSLLISCEDEAAKKLWLKEIRAQTDHFKFESLFDVQTNIFSFTLF